MPWFQRGLCAILTGRVAFLRNDPELENIVSNFVWEVNGEPAGSLFTFDDDGLLQLNLKKYTEIMLPRGFSKTTLAGIVIPIYKMVYQDIKFGVYVSEAGPHAKMQLTNVRRELTNNARLIAVFGMLRPDAKADEKWNEEFFETTNGCAFAARGRGGQIRGLNHLGQRPQHIIVDDVEDKESVATDEQREKVRNWFYSDLIPALPEMDENATIIVLGTLLHPDALLETLVKDPQWGVVRIGAHDKQGRLLWLNMLDEEKLLRKKESFAAAGQLHSFYMEYYNRIVAPETQDFKPHYIIFASANDIVGSAVYCDPAISDKRTADEAVILGCSMSQKGVIYIREGWGKRGASPREIVDEFFRQQLVLNARRNGIESIAYQAALVHLMREEMFRKHRYFELEAVTHKTRKVDRIRGILQPRFANGYIAFCRPFTKLQMQLTDFPNAAHDDWPDALAGCVSLLDPFAAAASGKDLETDEYEDIDEELGEWRRI
jgi:hypothetical protein